MQSPPWQRIEQLFEQAVDLPVKDRTAFLDGACGDDLDLRREVESLLAADHNAGTFLHAPALEGARAAASTGSTPWLSSGQELGPYRIVRPLGSGGMAAVYLASREQDYNQDVALKVFGHGLHRLDLVRRFEHERQILAKLEHPCISRLLDGGTTEDGLPYLVMEYVEGEPIDVYCNRRGLSVQERIDLFRQLCEAVHYAHQRLVVHRDIKPSNILVTADGTLKLLDFGIAKILQGAGPEDSESPAALLTHTDQRLMTPAYASPEQVRGEPMTTATDIYSLGVLLYRLLTDKLPYEVSDRLTDIERAILEDTPRRPSQTVEAGSLRRQLSGDLDHIVMQSLRKESTERYGSAKQLAEDLQRHRQGLPVRARGETLGYVTRRLVRRHRLAVTVAAVFLLTILGFTAYVVDLARRVSLERDEARLERDKAQRVAVFLEDIFEVPAPDQARGKTITAEEILDRGAAKLDQELQDQPEVYATLAATIAKVYTELGNYDAAAQILEHAISSSQDVLRGRPELATLLHRQGALGLSTGQVQQAETTLHQAAEMRRSRGGLELADTLDQLGVAHGMQGQFEEARPFFEESLAVRRQALGPRALEVASSLNHLANLHRMLSDLPTSRSQFEQALTIMAEVDPDHSIVANLHQNLALVHQDTGDFSLAADRFRTAIALKQDVYGEDHPSVLYSMANLGSALLRLGRDEEAEGYFQQAVSKMEELEVDTRLIGHNLLQWSDLDRNRGRFESAEDKVQRATRLLLGEFGEDNPHHAACLYKLARIRGSAGRLEEAETLHRQALEMRRKTFGDEGFIIASSHVELGHVLTAAGKLDEAEQHLRRGVELLTGTHGPDTWRTLNAEAELALCWLEQGRLDEAEPILRRVWEWTENQWGADHRKVQQLRRALDRLESLRASEAA